MSDPAAFVRAALGDIRAGPPTTITDLTLAELTRTPSLRQQFDRVRAAIVLQAEIDAHLAQLETLRDRARQAVQHEINEYNGLAIEGHFDGK